MIKLNFSKRNIILGISIVFILGIVFVLIQKDAKRGYIKNEIPDYVKKEIKQWWNNESFKQKSALTVKELLELSKAEKERLNWIWEYVKNCNNFVHNSGSLDQIKDKIKVINEIIATYKRGSVMRINPETWKSFLSIDDFKIKRIKELEKNLTSIKEQLKKESNLDLQNQLKLLETEYLDLRSNNNINNYVYYSNKELSLLIDMNTKELNTQNDLFEKYIKINNLKTKYQNYLKQNKSDFNINDIYYVLNILWSSNYSKDNILVLDLNDADNIVSQFETERLAKLTQNLSIWIAINSDSLYAKIKKDWKEIFVDESVYLRLKLSRKNGFNNFLLSKKSWDFQIYSFLSWFFKEQNYFNSLILKILDFNEEILSNIISWDANLDIKDKWILKNYFKYVKWEKQNNLMDQAMLIEILKNSL